MTLEEQLAEIVEAQKHRSGSFCPQCKEGKLDDHRYMGLVYVQCLNCGWSKAV